MSNKQMKIAVITYMILCFVNMKFLAAQDPVQTIRGKITDQDSRAPLPGANIVVLGADPVLGASTDINGEFRIKDVPVGRISLKVTYIGYEEKVLSNVLLTSGKEVLLDLELQESLTSMDEVVIRGDKDKGEITNEMALVSARGFTVEETKRYAGSFNDPARMASGYAGVDTDASGNNFIIVRGNSPKGILWRLEGIEIPNPNHFSDEGATGGPINALNSQMLDNSEFYTGAFAPEYGNALSGVLDMRMRKGNNEQREYSFSVGVLGTDVTLEGPFKKGGGSSYLVNYRYSTLTILNDLGLVDFDGIPKYQDLSFKVHVPTKSFGTFSFFGLGGKSNIIEKIYDDDDENDLLSRGDYSANMGVGGMTQYWSFGSNTYLQNSVTVSKNGSGYLGEEPNAEGEMEQHNKAQLDKKTVKGATTLNHKFNARHNLQVGLIYTQHYFDFYNEYTFGQENELINDLNIDGSAGHYQGFVSWKYRPWETLSVVSGAHVHGTTLNDQLSVEPRASLRWQFKPRQALSAGFGVHGKMESLTNYYSIVRKADGSTSVPNKDMGFSKARHYVIGYDNKLSGNLLMKVEVYYQQLYDVPVENSPASGYSLINQVEWFADRELVNEGTGENVGVELTLERFFANNYYFLLTTSLYDSKYEALDGVKRDTRFNGNYVGNLLFGKEFELNSKSRRKKVIGINGKVSLMGARRYTPIDLERSIEDDQTVRDGARPFSVKGDDVFIANLAITYRIDGKKASQELKLDVQNVTNNSARLGRYYNSATDEVEYFHQLPLLPVLMYTIHF